MARRLPWLPSIKGPPSSQHDYHSMVGHKRRQISSLGFTCAGLPSTSVSSECAFLSASITISKHYNHLKPNIVEVLQCLKCLIHCDLLFREDPSVLSEVGTDGMGTEGLGTKSEDSGWDNMI